MLLLAPSLQACIIVNLEFSCGPFSYNKYVLCLADHFENLGLCRYMVNKKSPSAQPNKNKIVKKYANFKSSIKSKERPGPYKSAQIAALHFNCGAATRLLRRLTSTAVTRHVNSKIEKIYYTLRHCTSLSYT